MPGVHATLSASGAHRWLNCPPSARLEQNFPETESPYASEGTLAHHLCELLLRKHFTPMKPSAYKKELAAIQSDPQYTQAMFDHSMDYLTFVTECRNEIHNPIIAIEQKVDFSKFVPEGFGTCDCVIIGDGVMRVIDFKYGAGVPVSAEDNPQLMLYAVGAYEEFSMIYDIDQIVMTIFQPRISNISACEILADGLINWANEIKPIAEEAFEGEGEFKAGDHCRFCRAKALCRARAEENLAVAKYEFKKAELLEDSEIGEILTIADRLKAWVADITEYALVQVRDHGKSYEGWKLVEGRSIRAYRDQDAVFEALIEAGIDKALITETNLLGITKMEKALGKKKFSELLEELIDKPPGKPTLVSEKDKRPAINSTAQAIKDFKEE